MNENNDQKIIDSYLAYLADRDFPCVAAREAVARQQVDCYVATHMACPHDDTRMLEFLYKFIDTYRKEKNMFHSAAIIFKEPKIQDERMFDRFMWQRLQAISDLDASMYNYDKRVQSDPSHAGFSFSLKEEALFILGLHPANNRSSRQFPYAVLAFNPHDQFEQMRAHGQYEKMKNIVRKREIALSGSVNPMLDDFGKSSEVFQYSGRQYDKEWQCPLNIKHGATQHHSSPERSSFPLEERSAS
ncbi:MAG TPA: guanitoxin biosynthesis heme-dependent pre-guanitoxin N-hydroxylase GntA [Flavitalea sp.]|nr:guanitoxin biosynthesis heme-dependent pre-guanitoxin N-hydroxylase GntA [Flavitalea sp.]